jgi:hypothetical protein
MAPNLPSPRPSFIDLGDHFIVDPAAKQNLRTHTEELVALTPVQRLWWHDRWLRHVRQLEREGKDVGKEIYGVEGLRRASF